ncbi:MAG: acyltransferase [Rhodobacteraceae bacterium]|nr:acyltransferase [Paracoccaceae bacterium]
MFKHLRLSGPGGWTARLGLKTIGQSFNPKENNFDLIRLFAAVLVLVSHCYPLTGQVTEPFANYLGEYDTGGGWGVAIFFVISGFLVARSVLGRSVGIYFTSRALRILPALALVTVFEIVVIGPMYTTQRLGAYFSNGETFRHLQNVSIFWIRQVLPDTFATNPQAHIVNGSLWTLPIESAFYILLPVACVLGLLKPRPVLACLAIVAALTAYTTTVLGWGWANQGGLLFPGGPAYYVLKQGLFFLIGAAFWIHRDNIPHNKYLALGCVALLVVFAWKEYRLVAMYIALPYLVIYAALARGIHARLGETIGDLSYGTYLFAFPVQQAIVAAHDGALGPGRLLLFALPLVLGLAFLSWRFVEQPALRLRHGLHKPRNTAQNYGTPVPSPPLSSPPLSSPPRTD